MSGSRFLEVVQALCDAPVGARLLSLQPGAATLAMPDGSLCAVVDTQAVAADDLEPRLQRFVRGNAHADLKLVLVGADPSHRAVLTRLQPRMMMGRVVQVFALDREGDAWAGARSRLDSPTGRTLVEIGRRDVVELAFEVVAALEEPPDPEQVARGREVASFVAKARTGRPWAVWTFLAVIAGVFALEWHWGGTELTPTLVRMGANLPARWLAEPWRVLASAWLHAGPVHVLVNGVALLLLGGLIERLLGWPRLVLLYVAAAVGGSVASAIGAQAELSVGASGAIWGILGASAALAWRPAGLVPAAVLPQLRRNALFNIAINLLLSMKPEIDLLAHLGGGVVGATLVWSGWLTRGVREGDRGGGGRLRTAAAIAGALLVAALPIAWWHGRPWALTDLEPLQTITLSQDDGTITVPPTSAAARTRDEDGLRRYEIGDLRMDAFELHVVVADESRRELGSDAALRAEASAVLGIPEAQLRQLEGDEAPRWPTFVGQQHEGQLHVLVAYQVRPDGVSRIEGAHWEQLPEFGAALDRALRSYDAP